MVNYETNPISELLQSIRTNICTELLFAIQLISFDQIGLQMAAIF